MNYWVSSYEELKAPTSNLTRPKVQPPIIESFLAFHSTLVIPAQAGVTGKTPRLLN